MLVAGTKTRLIHPMMYSSQHMILGFVVLSVLGTPADGCAKDMIGQCPNINMISDQMMATIIPLPHPEFLSRICKQVLDAVRCALQPSMLGKCSALVRAYYTSILNTLQYPCQRATAEYMSGRNCWIAPELAPMLKECYSIHSAAINSSYCIGQKDFLHCAAGNIVDIPNCGVREQRLLADMIIKGYNDMGLRMTPPCSEMTNVYRFPPTTTTTTTTTMATSFTNYRTTTKRVASTTDTASTRLISTTDTATTTRLRARETTVIDRDITTKTVKGSQVSNNTSKGSSAHASRGLRVKNGSSRYDGKITVFWGVLCVLAVQKARHAI